MKKLLQAALMALLCLANTLQAQDLVQKWIQVSGGKGFVWASDMLPGSDNCIFVTGNFKDTAYLGNVPLTSSGDFDIFLAKYDKTGKVTWAKKMGGNACDKAFSLVTDSKNNVYIAGTYKETCIFEKKQLTASGYCDIFIAKFNNLGELQWVNSIKGNTKGEKLILKTDSLDNLYLAGSFVKTIGLGDKTLYSTSGFDIFICKLNSNGDIIESTSFGGQGQEKLNDFVCTQTANLFITGSFTNELDFNGQLLQSAGKEDIFIARMDGIKPVWIKKAGGYYSDCANKIAIQGDKVYLSGSFTGESFFGSTSLLSEGVLDAFVCSYNTDGSFEWATKYGGLANEYINSLLVNQDGSLYISGSYNGKIQNEVSKIESEKLSKDIFMARFSKSGELIWSRSLGGSNQDFAVSFVKDKEGYIYQMGLFDKNLKIGKEKAFTEALPYNFFINKFYDCGISPKIDLGNNCTLCEGTELKVNGQFTKIKWNTGANTQSITVDQSGMYSVIATDKFGCKSSDTIEINILKIPKIDLGPDINARANEKIQLSVEGEFVSYLWSNGSKSKTLTLKPVKQDTIEMVSLTVTNEQGCQTTDSIAITRKSSQNQININDVNGNNMDYTIYPNPSKGKFYVVSNRIEKARQIDIFDIRGTLVKSLEVVHDFPVEIDLSGIGKGAYLIKISEEKQSRGFSIVIE